MADIKSIIKQVGGGQGRKNSNKAGRMKKSPSHMRYNMGTEVKNKQRALVRQVKAFPADKQARALLKQKFGKEIDNEPSEK